MRVGSMLVAEQFAIQFQGPGVEDNTIDAALFASSLLAMAELVDDVQGRVNPHGPTYRVNVATVEPGSFGVTLELQEIVHAVAGMLSSDQIAAAAVLKTLFGGPGVFELLRFLRGKKKPDAVWQAGEDSLSVEVDGRSMTVKTSVFEMSYDRSIRRNVRRFSQPLTTDEIDSVTILGLPDEPDLTLQRGDRAALTAPLDEELLTDHETEMWLTIDTIRWGSNRWAFRDPITQRLMHTRILDEAFLKRVDDRTVNFSKGDALYVRVRFQEWDSGGGAIETKVEVLRVLDKGAQSGQQESLLD